MTIKIEIEDLEVCSLNKRYIGALIISPMIIFIFLGGIYLHIFALVLSLIGIYEIYNAAKMKAINPIHYAGYFLSIAYYVIINKSFLEAFFFLIFMLLLLLCVPVMNTKWNFIDIFTTYFGVFYVSVFFSFIPLINYKAYGKYLVWIVFIASWSCDTLAYYSGKYLGQNGKHKLCPEVSPNKTVEGSIGGLLGSTVICGITGIIFNSITFIMPNIHFFIIGAICGILCQFGDLVASSIKRTVGIKDFSNLIPGHGGILDRFDSILFAAVTVFFYLTFVVNI